MQPDTPRYEFSRTELIRCYESMKNKMPGVKIHYALKANAEREVLQVLHTDNAYFEVASKGEYDKLLSIQVQPDHIICGLPVKPEAWLLHMYEHGCRYFVFDMIPELKKIITLAPDSKKILRINICDLIPESIDFGMAYKEILRILNDGRIVACIDGLSFHISNNVDVKKMELVLDRVEKLFLIMPKRPYILNIGGGYRLYAENTFYEVLNQRLGSLRNRYSLDIIAEPGNAIVNSAGTVITSVIGVRNRQGNQYDLYVDAGKPTGIKTDGKRIPTYIKLLSDAEDCEEREYRFVDITCMHKPHFTFKLRKAVLEGHMFEYGGMGAYSACLQSKFHEWDNPPVRIK